MKMDPRRGGAGGWGGRKTAPRGLWRWAWVGLLSGLCGCATSQQPFVVEAVGPHPKMTSHGAEGALQVYSATTEVNDGGIAYYPHTSYRIYGPDGGFVRFIRNHVGGNDQTPQTAMLPAGRYQVVAQSEGYGVVKVPVLVKGGQLTVLYLDRTPMPEAAQGPAGEVVRFPSGWAVGWRAREDGAGP